MEPLSAVFGMVLAGLRGRMGHFTLGAGDRATEQVRA